MLRWRLAVGDRETTTVKFRRSWSVANQAATFGCAESLLTSSRTIESRLGERREDDIVPGLGGGRRRRRRCDGLLGQRPYVGWRRLALGSTTRHSPLRPDDQHERGNRQPRARRGSDSNRSCRFSSHFSSEGLRSQS